MIKTHNVKQYLQSGIENNINNCEDTITSEYSNETSKSFEVEFTDYSMDGVKSKYRVTIENIDEIKKQEIENICRSISDKLYYPSKAMKEKLKQTIDEVKENNTMDNRVSKFLTEIMNGTESNTAIENSGVGEMKFKDVLREIAGAWKANRLEEILNCEEVIPNEEYQKLKEALNTIKELDESLLGMREDKAESNE